MSTIIVGDGEVLMPKVLYCQSKTEVAKSTAKVPAELTPSSLCQLVTGQLRQHVEARKAEYHWTIL